MEEIKYVQIPRWFEKKELGSDSGTALRTFRVIRETEKAYNLEITDYESIWCPKSIVEKVSNEKPFLA